MMKSRTAARHSSLPHTAWFAFTGGDSARLAGYDERSLTTCSPRQAL